MTAQQPEDHIKNPYTLAEIKTKIASNDYNAEMLLQHAMLLLEENGRKVLSYWPYCNKCQKPFEFEKEEPFASCGCPGSTEWGDPRPASWVQPPTSNARQPLTRQQVIDRFGFLEGIVNEANFLRIVDEACALAPTTQAAPAAQGDAEDAARKQGGL